MSNNPGVKVLDESEKRSEKVQIKSATENVGTFDKGNNDIRYSLRRGEKVRYIEEVNNKFNYDLKAYIKEGILPKNSRFELGLPSDRLLSAGFPKLPISMRVSLLNKKAGMERHPFSPTDLYNMVEAIQKPLAIFEYSKPNMRNLIVDLTKGEKHFLVGITLDYRKGELAVNSVSGLFPKENHEWLKWIQDKKAIRIDQKEKVLSLINSLRTNPKEAERIGLNLDTAAKVVENFENLTLHEENITPDMAKEVPTSGEANGMRYSLRHHNRQPSQMDTRAAELYEQMLSGRWSQIDEAWHDDLFICAAM